MTENLQLMDSLVSVNQVLGMIMESVKNAHTLVQLVQLNSPVLNVPILPDLTVKTVSVKMELMTQVIMKLYVPLVIQPVLLV